MFVNSSKLQTFEVKYETQGGTILDCPYPSVDFRHTHKHQGCLTGGEGGGPYPMKQLPPPIKKRFSLPPMDD